jgi:hypothetical protein
MMYKKNNPNQHRLTQRKTHRSAYRMMLNYTYKTSFKLIILQIFFTITYKIAILAR